jgi:ubiquinone/menaquinone biosynthesis C-methylase UbiE
MPTAFPSRIHDVWSLRSRCRTIAGSAVSLTAALLAGCDGARTTPPAPPAATETTAVAPPPAAPSPYVFGEATEDGIGKWYFGREIAQVMGHQAAAWLDRPERRDEERTDILIELLGLAPNAVVADIGAGSGTLSIPIAQRIPAGRVYAVDIQQEMLDLVRERTAALGVTNVAPILGTIEDARLPADSVDVVLLVDAYHEFSHPKEMLDSIHRALHVGGRFVLVEYRANDPRVPIKPLHTMTEAQARREVEASGFRWERTEPALPRQAVMIFRK